MPDQIGEKIWTMDGAEIVFGGAPMGTRMTVAQLPDGTLWVHSPIQLTVDVKAFVAGLGGRVSVLVGPNKFHHMYIGEWREAYPQARVFAEPALLTKVPELADAQVLTDAADELYSSDIEQLIFTGNRLFTEAVFFHKPSGTVIFTDLLINLRIDNAPLLARLFYRFEQVVYPHGGVPRLYRWLTSKGGAARQAAQQVLDWAPRQIVFSHGEPLQAAGAGNDATDILRREFAFLLE